MLVWFMRVETICKEEGSPQEARRERRVCSRIEEYRGIPRLSHTTLNLGLMTLGAMGVSCVCIGLGLSLKLEKIRSCEEVMRGLSFLQIISYNLSGWPTVEIRISSWLSLLLLPAK